MLTQEKILDALKDVQDPELHKSLVELNMVRDIVVKGEHVSLTVILTISGCPLKAKIHDDVVEAVKAVGAKEVNLTFGAMTDEERAALATQLRSESGMAPAEGAAPGAQQPAYISPLLDPESNTTFIAITSGKGGVGKSTATVNLAVSLARLGKKVGVIDADIYGFSVPDMMQIDQRPVLIDKVILPVEAHGVKVMSMGFFVHDNTPVIWRGPMLGKMLRNFFTEVHWQELDYLILDLPPGTGDIALDVHSLIPQSKEIIVTTPHPTASLVAVRAGSMAQKTGHEILGVIENMSYYLLPDGSKDTIFGAGGGAKVAEDLQTELLAQVPLGQAANGAASGSVYAEDSVIGQIYTDLAKQVIQKT